MNIQHVALVCRSEDNADRFYGHLLGLAKDEPKKVSPDLTGDLFNIPEEMTVLNYKGPGVHFEVFVCDRDDLAAHPVAHVCFQVDSMDDFLAGCRELGVEVRQARKGDKTITFVKDFDGNLFEVKS